MVLLIIGFACIPVLIATILIRKIDAAASKNSIIQPKKTSTIQIVIIATIVSVILVYLIIVGSLNSITM